MKLGFHSKIVLTMTLLFMNCAPASSAKMTPSKEDSDKILDEMRNFFPRALKCFHETGKYVDTKIDSISYDKENVDSVDVIIIFKGVLSGKIYNMTLRLRKKK